MTNNRSPILVAALFVGLALAGPAVAGPPRFADEVDQFVLSNDAISVTFHNKTPNMTITSLGSADSAPLAYRFTELVEYRDLNGDGAPSDGEIVARVLLSQANWTAVPNVTAGAVTLALHLTAPVEVGPQASVPAATPALPLPARLANLSLSFTLHEAASALNASGVDVVVPPTTLTYELQIHAWPFVNAELDRLALRSRAVGELALDDAPGLEGGQLATNGTALGALAWSPIAVGNTTKGETIDIPVKAIATPVKNETEISFTYDAADLAGLSHTATAGAPPVSGPVQGTATNGASGLKDVPGPGLLVAGVAVGLAAWAARRK